MAEDLYLKRLRYFNHQFLRLEDFETEQDYHLRMRREHNRRFHQWGVAAGLEVQVGSGDRRQVRVTPGVALDAEGREIVLPVEVVKTVSGAGGEKVYVTVAFAQERASPTTESGPEEYRRWREVPAVELRAELPSDPSMELVLAELTLDAGGAVASVAPGGRRPVGAVSPELRALFLVPVDGDAQRVTPGGEVRPLKVMLANAGGPVTDPNVSVRFTALAGSGTLQGGGTEVTLPFTDASGIVGCAWTPDPSAADQTVTAVLVAPNGTELGAPTELRFHAGAEAARLVSYAPGTASMLDGKTTVQAAVSALADAAQTAAATISSQGTTLASHAGTLATLGTTATTLSTTAKRMRLVPLSGDDQTIVSGETLKAMKVLVVDADGPVRNTAVKVRFQVTGGTGTLNGSTTATSHEVPVSATDGTATCSWAAASSSSELEVTATLVAPTGTQTSAPTALSFRATRMTADRVGYSGGASTVLGGKTTVQAALTTLGTAAEDAQSSISSLNTDVGVLKGQAGAWRLRPASAEFWGIKPLGGQVFTLSVQLSTASGAVTGNVAQVRFVVVAGNGSVNFAKETFVTVDPVTGMASVQWRPDLATMYQEVAAEVVTATGRTYTFPGKITFRGVLEAPGNDRPGVEVEQIAWQNGAAFGNDWGFVLDYFRQGLVFLTSEPVNPVYEKNVKLWVELPYPLTNAEMTAWGVTKPVGKRRVELDMMGPVPDVEEASIYVQPTTEAYEWLQNKVFPRLAQLYGSGKVSIRAGVTLKGSYLWTLDGEKYLKGGVFGKYGVDGNFEPRLEPGAPREHGDLEIWFYLQDFQGTPYMGGGGPTTSGGGTTTTYGYGYTYSYVSYPMYTSVYGYRPGFGYGYYDQFTGIGTRLL